MQPVIIVSDIFGNTPALKQLSKRLPFNTSIFDPYQGQHLQFISEKHAYQHFTDNIGLDKYTQLLAHFLAKFEQPVSLIGFSVGTSAIWKLSALACASKSDDLTPSINISSALGFYSAQIRHFYNLQPAFPIQLVFPVSENSFCVNTLMHKLAYSKNVWLHQAPYLHGFMNQCSQNFNATGYQEFLSIMSICTQAELLHTINFTHKSL